MKPRRIFLFTMCSKSLFLNIKFSTVSKTKQVNHKSRFFRLINTFLSVNSQNMSYNDRETPKEWEDRLKDFYIKQEDLNRLIMDYLVNGL